MSEQEKAQQIGELVQLREQQKKDLAHLRAKGERISAAYSAFAYAVTRWGLDAQGGAVIQRPEPREREAASYLLSRQELGEYIAELQESERALQQTNQQLAQFGITS